MVMTAGIAGNEAVSRTINHIQIGCDMAMTATGRAFCCSSDDLPRFGCQGPAHIASESGGRASVGTTGARSGGRLQPL